MSATSIADRSAVVNTVTLFAEPGQIVEVRALEGKLGNQYRCGTLSGYFDAAESLADAVIQIQSAVGIYFVINPPDSVLLARAHNRIKLIYKEPTTSDADIVRRRWLPVDADPVRPAGISSDDEEHDLAIETVRHVRDELVNEGWPAGIVADSGNGGHLDLRIDLPRDDGGLVEQVLAALQQRFGTDKVKIDQTLHNPARILRLYGTKACKGDNVPGRPHRMSRILEVPTQVEPVPRELLEELVAKCGSKAKTVVPVTTQFDDQFDLPRWIHDKGLQVIGPEPWKDGSKWVFETCPWNSGHTDRSAYIVQVAGGGISAGCKHNGCKGKGWHDVRDVFEPDWRDRRSFPPKPEFGRNVVNVVSDDDVIDDPWPDPPAEEAYHGLAGEIVRTIDPASEADPVAVLVQLLIAFGNVVGRKAHFVAEADHHYSNLFATFVGRTSKGRKGSSWSQVRRFLMGVDLEWTNSRILSGLSSGEGLIWAVRDPIYKTVKDRKTKEYIEECADEGSDDKRLLVMEAEFGSVLKVIARERNTLSAIIRLAWDSGNLQTLTKNSPAKASGAHISIIGHITRNELRRYISDTELANGLANRFLWICVKRSKVLPDGGVLDTGRIAMLSSKLQDAVEFAKEVELVRRTDQAKAIWRAVYPELSEGKSGLLGAATSRAEAVVMRLSLLYALLDQSTVIDAPHLSAALALWDYAESSAKHIFGSALGDPTADSLLAALRAAGPQGMTRTEMRDHFGKNKDAAEIARGLGVLSESGLARCFREAANGQGRPAERWFCA